MASLLPRDGLAGAVLEERTSRSGLPLNTRATTNSICGACCEPAGSMAQGSAWLIKLASLEAHLRVGQLSRDQRSARKG